MRFGLVGGGVGWAVQCVCVSVDEPICMCGDGGILLLMALHVCIISPIIVYL